MEDTDSAMSLGQAPTWPSARCTSDGSLVSRTRNLSSGCFVVLNPDDAQRLGVRTSSYVSSLASASLASRTRVNKEPTNGLEPLSCSIRVIHQALQGLAQPCKSRISKPVSFLRLAPCCPVLRSRRCQSGVNSTSYRPTDQHSLRFAFHSVQPRTLV